MINVSPTGSNNSFSCSCKNVAKLIILLSQGNPYTEICAIS